MYIFEIIEYTETVGSKCYYVCDFYSIILIDCGIVLKITHV